MVLDPLHNVADQERHLFNQMAALGNGFATDQVIGACLNVLVNAMRQAHATRDSVMGRADQINGEVKKMLDRHYDLTGKRLKGAFPYHQIIEAGHFDARVKIK